MVSFGEKCYKDTDCTSNICQYTGAFNERKCVRQQPKYGMSCNINNDCKSNRCIVVNDYKGNYVGKKCVVIDNQHIPKKRNIDLSTPDEDNPFSNDPNYRKEMEDGLILNQTQKNIGLEGRGPAADLIILAFEVALFILKMVVDFLKSIFRLILRLVSLPFGFISADSFFGFSKKYKDPQGKCDVNSSVTINKDWINFFFTLLFPPLGVFFSRGINGIGHVIITGFLTTFLYFPGLIYALDIINEKICPDAIIVYDTQDYTGNRYIFSYGDYNMSNSEKLQSMKSCMPGNFENINMENFANIQAIKLGKDVEVILYADNNFTQKIMTITENHPKLLDLFYNDEETKKHIRENCLFRLGQKMNMPKIMSISIRLKKPLKVEPTEIDPNTVVCYLLNDFRGKYIVLREGDYNQNELGTLFNDRISSMKIGANVAVRLYEDDNYNKKLFVNYSTIHGGSKQGVVYTNTRGEEKTLTGKKTPEITNLSHPDFNFYDTISCIRIKAYTDGVDLDNLFKGEVHEGRNSQDIVRQIVRPVVNTAINYRTDFL